MKKLIFPIAGAAIAVIVAIVFIASSGGQKTTTPAKIEKPASKVEVGSKAPDFTLNDFSGQPVSLSSFAGKPVVVNFWAAWCPFCIDEMPDFEKVHLEFGDKVAFLGIHRSETEDPKIGAEFSTPLVSYSLLADTTGEVYKTLTSGQQAMPFTMIIDKDGKVAFRKFGPMTGEELREKVEQAI